MRGVHVGAVVVALTLVVAACGGAADEPTATADAMAAEVQAESAVESQVDAPETPTSTSTSTSTSSPNPNPTATPPPTLSRSPETRPTRAESDAASEVADEVTGTATTETTVDASSASDAPPSTAPPTTAPTTVTTAATTVLEVVTETTASAAAADPTPTSSPVADGPDRDLVPQAYEPFATFAEVTLLHPSNRVERIGFHESNHDGARQLEPTSTAVNAMVLETRNRGNGSHTAADIVVQPGTEIRSPVTGTVLRAGGYILYCKHNDDFVVIEPDAHPGWEVKLLHISGVTVSAGDRVEAGITVLAPMATPLPFDSQVDEFTGEPSWPHVHIELVDPSIPDRPSSGGGC